MLAKKVLTASACFSLFLSLVLITPSNAQGGENRIIIVSGTATTYNNDISGQPPLKFYKSSPPFMAAIRTGAGAVVAAGMATTCSNNNWNSTNNPYPHLDVLLAKAFKWMKSGATKVLWYEGHDVYETASACSQLVSALENLGYSVTARGKTAPDNYITSSLLTAYDILVIPQLQLGDDGTGGNPTLLGDAEVQAIKNFVEGGGGLLIMEGSDYMTTSGTGGSYSKVQNKILRALDTSFYFQDDQVVDDNSKWDATNYKPIAVIDGTTEIGSAYQVATGETKIGLVSICSLIMEEDYDVSVRVSPKVLLGNAGQVLTFEATITNIGTNPDNYAITIGATTAGWNPSISLNRISLENGENVKANILVTVPTNLTEKMTNQITLTAAGDSGAIDNMSFKAVNILPYDMPTFNGVTYYPIDETSRFLAVGVADLLLSPPAVPIITAIKSGYSEDLTIREPQPTLYGKGEFPPVGAAALVGSGRVVAIGNSILRNTYFDRTDLANDEVMSLVAWWSVNWKDPGGDNLLYYVAGSGVYHVPDQVSKWLDMLTNNYGFNVSTNVDGAITPELLENLTVFNLAELTRPLSSAEIQTIVDWVNAGGGLIIMCQADYSGYGAPAYVNAVLDALNSGIKFQDDEVYDKTSFASGLGTNYWWCPEVYLVDSRVGNPQVDVWYPPYAFTTSLGWNSVTVESTRALFPLTITNTGTSDSTYIIDAVETTTPENLDWVIDRSQTEVDIASGENRTVFIFVNVPDVTGTKRMNINVKVQDNNRNFLKKDNPCIVVGDDGIQPAPAKFENGATVYNDSWGTGTITDLGYGGRARGWMYTVTTAAGELVLVAEADLSTSQPGSPLLIIVAAIVVIVAIVIVAYFVMLKKK